MGVEENYHCNSQIVFFKLVTKMLFTLASEHILHTNIGICKEADFSRSYQKENFCFEVQNWKQ